jgi:SH3-like domain-containing protein
VAVLDQGVIGRMRECGAGWCLIEVEGRRGWIERRRVWGVLPGEVTARAE